MEVHPRGQPGDRPVPGQGHDVARLLRSDPPRELLHDPPEIMSPQQLIRHG
jgi:hypothetical protein